MVDFVKDAPGGSVFGGEVSQHPGGMVMVVVVVIPPRVVLVDDLDWDELRICGMGDSGGGTVAGRNEGFVGPRGSVAKAMFLRIFPAPGPRAVSGGGSDNASVPGPGAAVGAGASMDVAGRVFPCVDSRADPCECRPAYAAAPVAAVGASVADTGSNVPCTCPRRNSPCLRWWVPLCALYEAIALACFCPQDVHPHCSHPRTSWSQ